MADHELDISRRKVLAGLGTIGVASVGAGAGTSAFLNDEESFDNNSLAAGELDLRVGWEEHYSDWSDDEGNGIASIEMVGENETANESRVGLPLNDAADADTPANGTMITVENVSQARRFLNNTVPATNGSFANGTVDGYDPGTATGDPCQYLAPGADQSPVVIDLDDVKPGDFGEVTFSLALCDNPGYLWMQGALESASENGVTEPEGDSPKEGSGVELLDEIRAAAWYDDGDNLQSGGGTTGGGGPVCVELVLDASGSMGDPGDPTSKTSQTIDGATTLAQKVLNANDQNRVGVTFFSADGYDESAQNQLSVDSADAQTFTEVEDAIDDLPGNGGDTAIGAGIETGQTDLQDCPDSHDRVMILLSNGSENVEPDADVISDAQTVCSDGTEIYTISIGADSNDQQFMEDIACSPDNAFTGASASAIEGIFDELTGEIIASEEVFLKGTLRDVINNLASGAGVCLDGDTSTAFDEVGGDPTSDSREAFAEQTRHDIGFAWWLPASVGNQVQSDTASFSLGFYTEQARHNDGGGNQTTTSPPS